MKNAKFDPGGKYVDQALGESLARLCKQTGMTQAGVGKILGKQQSVVNKYFTGEVRMTFADVYRLSLVLGIDMGELNQMVIAALDNGPEGRFTATAP